MKGADWEVEWRYTEDELRAGTETQISDVWHFTCDACGGCGVSGNRACSPCGASGRISREYNVARLVVIRAGTRAGARIRVRGWGYHGNPDVPENRGDRYITVRLFGDGEIRDELPPASSLERRETQALPPTRALRNRLSGGR